MRLADYNASYPQMLCHLHAAMLDCNGIVELMQAAGLSIEGAGTALLSVVSVPRTRYLIQVSDLKKKLAALKSKPSLDLTCI